MVRVKLDKLELETIAQIDELESAKISNGY